MTIQTIETSLANDRSSNSLSRSLILSLLVAVICGMTSLSVAAEENENPLTFRDYLAMLDREIDAAADAKNGDTEDTDPDDEEVPELEDDDSSADRKDEDDADEGRDAIDDEEDDEEMDDEDNGLLGKEDEGRIAEMVQGRFVMPSLAAISTATNEVGNGEVPESFRDASVAPVVALPESAMDRAAIVGGPAWGWSTRTWAAPNTFSNPRYFEDRMLERHGHERWGCSQPLFAGARFFATIPMLPYLMAIEHPCHCESSLGYHRSGSCTPTYFQRPPWDRKALVAESFGMASGLWIMP